MGQLREGARPGARLELPVFRLDDRSEPSCNVAYRTGKKIEWDYKNLLATNAPEAAPFIKRPSYRKDWEGILKG